MSLVNIVKKLMQPVAFSVALASSPVYISCGEDTKPGCSDDYDCREPRICVDNECVYGDGKTDSGSEEGPCGNSPLVGKYLWNVGNCESASGLFSSTCYVEIGGDIWFRFQYQGLKLFDESGGVIELIRTFNCEDVPTDDWQEGEPVEVHCESYRCFLANTPDLYLMKHISGIIIPKMPNYGKVELGDNLWRIMDEPWPGKLECRSRVESHEYKTGCHVPR